MSEPDPGTNDGHAQIKLEEIVRNSISCTIREAGKRLNRGTRYTRKIAELLQLRRVIDIAHYKRVCDWRLSMHDQTTYWPCACVFREERGSMTHVKLNHRSQKRCDICGSERPYGWKLDH